MKISSKYGSTESKYCYPGTDILINKLDIRDEVILKEADAAFSNQRLIELGEKTSPVGNFDVKHLRYLHYYIFQDLYSFAGRVAYYMAELNVIHPFRDGNGRAIREFIRSLAQYCGYTLNWKAISKKELLEASIQSVLDTEHLTQCIEKAIEKDVS